MCMYKMVDIDKETYKNNDIEVIVDDTGTLWLKEKHIQKKNQAIKIYVITKKYDHV